MPSLQVKKAVAVSFLEAAKLTLEHLAAYRLELSPSPVAASAASTAAVPSTLLLPLSPALSLCPAHTHHLSAPPV